MTATSATNRFEDSPATILREVDDANTAPTYDCGGAGLTKSEIAREFFAFITKAYRLVYVAVIIYALGPLAAITVGLLCFGIALYRCPDEPIDQVVNDAEFP